MPAAGCVVSARAAPTGLPSTGAVPVRAHRRPQRGRVEGHHDRLAALLDVLAGMPVTRADRWVLGWLAEWDAGTVATVVKLICCARRHTITGPPPIARSTTAGVGSVSRGLAEEIETLAALLTEVVDLAADRAVFPSRLEMIAELAREHDSVRRALLGHRGVVSGEQAGDGAGVAR